MTTPAEKKSVAGVTAPTTSPNGLVEICLARPIVSLIVLIAAQHVLLLGLRDLWWADEARHADVLRHLLDQGHWLALKLNDSLYPDKPPIYFWFIGAVATLAGGLSAPVLFAGLGLTVIFFTLCTYALALTSLRNKTQALTSALVLSTGLYAVIAAHYARMDFLFAGFIALSWLFFFRATRPDAPFHMAVLAWVFAAVATFTKGPVGILLPVLGLLTYLAWSQNLKRLLAWDMLTGFITALAIAGLWIGGMIAVAGTDYFIHILDSQIVERGFEKKTAALGLFQYAVTFPLLLLPWPFLLIALSRSSVRKAVLSWRQKTKPDTAKDARRFLWASLLSGFVALSLISEKHEYYLIPLLMPAAILIASALNNLDETARSRFWIAAAGFLAIFGAALASTGFFLNDLTDGMLALGPRETVPAGLVLIAGAVWLIITRQHPTLSPLTALAVILTLWINVFAVSVLPKAGPLMSPKTLALELRQWNETEYDVAAYGMIPGVLGFYLDAPYYETRMRHLLRRWLNERQKAAVAMPLDQWRLIAKREPYMREVFRTQMAGAPYVIMVKD